MSAIILNFTRAKYRVTQSISLVNGTINYTPYDFKMIAMYQVNDSGEYVEIDKMPSNGYILNEEKSYCEVNGIKDNSAILKTINGNHTISNLNKKSKCYLYFDELQITNIEELIASKNLQRRTNFNTTLTTDTTGTIFYEGTSKGITYYFAGNSTDNWVKFAEFYWRIIRINEDGTLRMIYQGTSSNTIGEGTQIGTSAFNSSYNDNMYVGYMYTGGSVHGTGTESTIKDVLDSWYQSNLSSYASKIDGNAGFCGDRTPSTSSSSSNNLGGIGTTKTYYGGFMRLFINKEPTFECANSSDLYTSESSQGNKALTYPIGLISADEVAYAGGAYAIKNQNYYLYTNMTYWTISSRHFDSNGAGVFAMSYDGGLNYGRVTDKYGVRPVINLKADIQFISGDGTASNPYIIS